MLVCTYSLHIKLIIHFNPSFLCCCPVAQLPAVTFSVQNLPFTDSMLAVWAQLVSLAGSKLEKQHMKKSLSRGLTGAERHNENVVDH